MRNTLPPLMAMAVVPDRRVHAFGTGVLKGGRPVSVGDRMRFASVIEVQILQL